ncbi:MAG: HD domain-containing protein [Lachnospira sp.]|nr:HD domain-containing protein [Lachnospira sp.]
MANYKKLSDELQERIKEDRANHVVFDYACKDEDVVRRVQDRDKPSLWRPAYVRDVEKIMNVPYYSRYADKTQVFSFSKNDDISRRSYHVQLVSRIARNIGRVLGLNIDLIEAIALGHDMGHTPFGHEGERQLSAIYHGETGRYFNHNVQSVGVLDRMINWNISLQTLDGIICHNGEMEQQEYRPQPLADFTEFDRRVEGCIRDEQNIGKLVPCTLEGCVVRISDIIAYLGKDRQDAEKVGMLSAKNVFASADIGSNNAEIINNLSVNIIENSYGKPYLSMDKEVFEMLKKAKKENGEIIYRNSDEGNQYKESVQPMMEAMYEAFLKDVKNGNRDSLIYKHHIDFVKQYRGYGPSVVDYEETEANQIVVDYIASMTDDYFVDLYEHMFGDKYKIKYVGYFD